MTKSPEKLKSLRGKFVRILLMVSLLMSIVTTSIVALMSAQASAEHFTAVQSHIQNGIISKGRVLTQQHALALRSLALDNAFLDMQRLVERAVKDDEGLVYGLFVNAEGATLATSRRGDGGNRDQLPDRAAWSALGLSEGELLVKSPGVKRVTRLGRDLLEVAVPVSSEEGEALGTIRYALSTQPMHEALTRAKHESDTRLWRSLGLMVTLVGVVTGLGLVLSRAQAVRVTEPVSALQRAAEALAGGDRSARVDIKSDDELALLGSSFNRMVDELDGSYRELEYMNRTLEQQVEARTAELALRNRDMRLVLDNVDRGFVNLSPAGLMAGERSAIVSEWFGASESAQAFWDYVAPVSDAFAAVFREAWLQIEEGFLPLDVCLGQLPTQLTHGERSFSFRYLPFHSGGDAGAGGQLEGVLLVIADVTERLAREREEAQHAELMQCFKKLVSDRSGFTSFLQEAAAMLEQIVSPAAAADTTRVKRTLHTLKGNAAVMGLSVVASLCHALETELAAAERMSPRALGELRSRWTVIEEHVASFVGASDERVIEVPEAEYAAVLERLAGGERPSELLKQLRSWSLEPTAKPLSRLAEQARSLARRLGRGEIDVDLESGDVRLDSQYWAPFFADLVHVLRNAVDHGLELPSERSAVGKPARGRLALKTRIEGSQLVFEISDDGRGIDWGAIAERASAQGLPHSTQAELLDALCADGVTTRTRVTDVSGRGVGMASFRQRLSALAGRLEVRSTKGVGTSWLMRFHWPIKPQRELVGLPRSAPASGSVKNELSTREEAP